MGTFSLTSNLLGSISVVKLTKEESFALMCIIFSLKTSIGTFEVKTTSCNVGEISFDLEESNHSSGFIFLKLILTVSIF